MWTSAGTVAVALDISAADVVGVVGVGDLLVVLFILFGDEPQTRRVQPSWIGVLGRRHADSLLNCDRIRLICKRLETLVRLLV